MRHVPVLGHDLEAVDGFDVAHHLGGDWEEEREGGREGGREGFIRTSAAGAQMKGHENEELHKVKGHGTGERQAERGRQRRKGLSPLCPPPFLPIQPSYLER